MSTGAAPTNTDILQRVALLEQAVGGLRDSQTLLLSKIDSMAAAQAARDKPDWQRHLAMAALAATMIGGGWTVLSLHTENTVLKNVMPLAVQNSTSAKDRDDMRAQIDALENKAGGNSVVIGEINRDLREVETQFCSLSDQLNYRLLSTHRLLDQLWRKAFGQPLANYEASPRIGRCS